MKASPGCDDADVDIRSRQLLLDGFFRVEQVTLSHRLLDGHMSQPLQRLHLDRGDGAALLLHDPERRTIFLVRQFRFASWEQGPGWLLETVAGVVEPGKTPAEVARQEAWEEAGFRLDGLEPVSTFYLTPGGSSERIFLFYAAVDATMQQSRGGGLEEEGEDIEVVEMPLEQAWEALDTGLICDAKTIIALQWLRQRQAT